MAATQRFAMGLALTLCLCSSWLQSSEAILEFGLGSAAIKTSFFRLGFSVCHQSEVCGVNGKTYQSPCAMADEGVEMACKRPCPCEQPQPQQRSRREVAYPEHLPHVEDVWIAAPTAIIISPPGKQGDNHSGGSGKDQQQEHRSGDGNESGQSSEDQHNGQNDGRDDVCRQRADPGPCQPNEYHVQYYFDFTRGSCSPFLYGGCEGNKNRFSSRHDCEKACGAQGK